MSQFPHVDRSEDHLSTSLAFAVVGDEVVLLDEDLEVPVDLFDPLEAFDLVDGSLEDRVDSEVVDEEELLHVEQVPMSARSFARWTAVFMAGHVAATVAGLGGLIIASAVWGLSGAAIALPLVVVLLAAMYYRVGQTLRERFAQHAATAWKPAFVGAMLPSALAATAGLGVGALGFPILFGLAAHAGARDF